MSDERSQNLTLPIDGKRFETARGAVTARLVQTPGYKQGSSCLLHLIEFSSDNLKREMVFWLPSEFIVIDPTMEKTHKKALEAIHRWIESDDFTSNQRDYLFNDEYELVCYDNPPHQ